VSPLNPLSVAPWPRAAASSCAKAGLSAAKSPAGWKATPYSRAAYRAFGLLVTALPKKMVIFQSSSLNVVSVSPNGSDRRVRSHYRFRYRGTEYVSESGAKRMRGGAKRQTDNATAPGVPPRAPLTRCGRSPASCGRTSAPAPARTPRHPGRWPTRLSLLAAGGGRRLQPPAQLIS
jgi:hypothetical protein